MVKPNTPWDDARQANEVFKLGALNADMNQPYPGDFIDFEPIDVYKSKSLPRRLRKSSIPKWNGQ